MTTSLFFLVALGSEIVGTVGGFGSSVFFVPLAGLLLDFRRVLALTSILHVFSNTAKLILFRRHLNRRLILLIGLPSILFVVAGAYLISRLELKYAELTLGAFLVLFSAAFARWPTLKMKATWPNAVVSGSVAGFLAGFVGTGGAIRGAALAAFSLEKNTFVATSAAIDFGVDFSRMVIYVRNGFLAPEHYAFIPGLLVVAFLGSWLGKRILEKLQPQHFRAVVLVLIFVIGLITVWKSVHDLVSL